MRRKHLLWLGWACYALLLTPSCKPKTDTAPNAATNASSKTRPADGIPTQTHAPNGLLRFEGRIFQDSARKHEISYTLDIPQGDAPIDQFVKKTLFEKLDGKLADYGGKPDFQRLVEDWIKKAIEDHRDGPPWTKELSIRNTHNSPTLLSFRGDYSEYTGGTNNEGGAFAINIDPKNPQTLENEKLVADEQGLLQLLRAEAKRTKALNRAQIASLSLPYCIYFEQDKAVFLYSIQEIDDNASEWSEGAGCILELPLRQVAPYLSVQ